MSRAEQHPAASGREEPSTERLAGQDDEFTFQTTEEIEVPDRLIDQVIGQSEAREIIELAAHQNRFVMLMGEPGTGKSMLGAALSELLPSGSLKDVLSYPNPEEPNRPDIVTVPAGKGKKRIEEAKQQEQSKQNVLEFLFWVAVVAVAAIIIYMGLTLAGPLWYYLIGGAVAVGIMIWGRKYVLPDPDVGRPKLLINNAGKESAPFVDATGAHAGALFGDVRHDPYQSGGAQTPPHQLVEVGAIHRAHGGVLYIDEVSTLGASSQQDLLTAIQEKEFHITGRTPGSSGSMVRTEPVPCDFVLVLAGNLQDLEDMHPALRSRIRGYGYEVLTNHTIEDSEENHRKIAQFVAQEVRKDGKIPHFDPSGVRMILREAHRRSDVDGKLTGRLRDLGGLVRAAGDVARKQNEDPVTEDHVKQALSKVKTLEEQMEDREEFAQSVDGRSPKTSR